MTAKCSFSEQEPLLNTAKNPCGDQDTILTLEKTCELAEYPQETFGYFLLFCSAIWYTTMGLIVRFATGYQSFPVSTVALFLGIELSLVGLISILQIPEWKTILPSTPKNLFLVSLRGFLGALSMYLVFLSLSILPLGVQTSLYFLNPIFTLALSSQILGEAFGIRELSAAVVSFIGVVLVSNPSLEFNLASFGQSNYAYGCFIAAMSGLVVAGAFVTLKSYGTKIHFMVSVLSLGIWTGILGVLMGGVAMKPILASPLGACFVAFGCFFGVLSQCFLNKGFQYCRAGTGTMIRNVDVPISYLFGLLFLDEVPHSLSLVGSAMVISGTVVVGTKHWFKK